MLCVRREGGNVFIAYRMALCGELLEHGRQLGDFAEDHVAYQHSSLNLMIFSKRHPGAPSTNTRPLGRTSITARSVMMRSTTS